MNKTICAFFGIIILSYSCAPVYVPNSLNAPMLNEKGDINAAVYGGTSGLDIQLAYAASDHLGVMLNGSFVKGAESNDNVHDHNFIEIGAGYYKPFSDRNTFEVFGGAGLGSTENTKNLSGVSKNVRLFIQPSIGIESDILDGSAAVRLAHVFVKSEGRVESAVFCEPALTAKIGYKNIKGVVQVGFSTPLFDDNVRFEHQPFLLSLGLNAKLNLKN